ncbi:hypothetical protein [[Clostridium] polysaccharolyticum]|jgi:hypothetical protein|uniref:Uncharacterized protein n=1 Tax=[Clostridium] polysaccharolyticum TaxID=29364 RepID=A0A1I0CXN5_9FIRM|nr:hypothetical protein [[Clostridium] polysaccharolyticum]SET24615.1 hypothetical protein SAMN04487772_11212 [[Clostridium] polysaccharolyticum]
MLYTDVKKFEYILSEESLYIVNGGDKADFDFGYKCGRAARTVCNAVKSAFNTVKSWF